MSAPKTLFTSLYRRRNTIRKVFLLSLVAATFFVFFGQNRNPTPTINGIPVIPITVNGPVEPFRVSDNDVEFLKEQKLADKKLEKYEDIHIVIAYGRDYIKPAFACLNSMLKNTHYPSSKLHFYFVIEDLMATRIETLTRLAFPEASVKIRESIREDDDDEEDIIEKRRQKRRIGGGDKGPIIEIVLYDVTLVPDHKIWVGPRNLDNPLNFVRFQLTAIFPDLKKVIYIDPDTIVQGDIAGMWKRYLRDNKHVIAAVPGTNAETYRKFIINNSIAKIDLNVPYFNAGVMMINLELWEKRQCGNKIKKWLDLNLKTPVYKYGSQPPLLLTFYKNYEQMKMTWNFRHLGHKDTLDLNIIKKAKILHYNGPRKPWRKNYITQYKIYWDKYFDFSEQIKGLADWGFEGLQDKYLGLTHTTCSTRSKCSQEASELGYKAKPVHMYIDGMPNAVKYKPMLLSFLKTWFFKNTEQFKKTDKKTYNWEFFWLRKQSDLPKRIKAMKFRYKHVDPRFNKVNFIRGFWEESYNKDQHCRNVQRYRKKNPNQSEGMLQCYVLPEQYEEFAEAQKESGNVWIGKLFAESSGHGIELYPSFSDVPPPQATIEHRIIQEYVKKPFLIEGKKTDLRVYVMVTSLDPLRVYVHPSGQVKVAQALYNSNFTDQFAHVSNKVGSAERTYDTANDELRKQRQIDEFKSRKVIKDLPDIMGVERWAEIWRSTENLLVRSMLTFIGELGCNSVKYSYNCGSAYQLLGVDIVYDSKFVPHLMEINNDPGWNPYFERRNFVSENLDPSEHDKDEMERVFTEVYGDTLHITGVLPYRKDYRLEVEQRYNFLCEMAELTQSCVIPEVKHLVLQMADEFMNAGSFRLAFPLPDWKQDFGEIYSFPEHIEEYGFFAFEIFTNYFSYETQDKVLYKKPKAKTKK